MSKKDVLLEIFKVEKSLFLTISSVEESIKRSRIFAKMIILAETLFLIIAGINYSLKMRMDFFYECYMSMYLLMIGINSLWLMYTKKYSKQKEKTKAYIRKWEYLLMAYIGFIIAWGSVISLLDQKLYGQIVAYIINLFACAIIYYLDNKKSLLIYSLATSILVIGLPFVQPSKDILIGHYINIIILVFWAWLASSILYYYFSMNLKKQELLSECNIHLEESNRKLREISLKDELTQIGNRRALNDYIEALINYDNKEGREIFIMVIDVDWFKLYNDTYGHLEGDKVLVKVAEVIQNLSDKKNDFCARFGGEEYIYIGINWNKEAFLEQGERVRMEVLALGIIHESALNYGKVTISIGIASTKVWEKEAIVSCINRADKALYTGKEKGKNCIIYLEK